jgi:hypothetical protein
VLKTTLTLWYALAVLIGPAACCCSWVTAKAHAAVPQKAPAPKRVKACCSAPVGNSPEAQPAGKTPAHDPAKCPCKGQKKVVDSAPSPAAAPDPSAAHRLAEWVAVAVVPVLAPSALVATRTDSLAGPPPLGGRALLSAYHILRC